MTRAIRLGAYAAVVTIVAPFLTPDMPWWAGLAFIGAVLAVAGPILALDYLRLRGADGLRGG
jgi:hypothetical protein